MKFTATDKSGLGLILRWEDGVFTTNFPPYLHAVNELIESGYIVNGMRGISIGPHAPAAAQPGWVALATAELALEWNLHEDMVWDVDVAFPAANFGYPEGSVS